MFTASAVPPAPVNSGLAISFCAPEEAQRANILAEMLQLKLNWVNADQRHHRAADAEMATLCIDGGKKRKCALAMCLAH
jgi:ATP-independent RNA helicase DbpA